MSPDWKLFNGSWHTQKAKMIYKGKQIEFPAVTQVSFQKLIEKLEFPKGYNLLSSLYDI